MTDCSCNPIIEECRPTFSVNETGGFIFGTELTCQFTCDERTPVLVENELKHIFFVREKSMNVFNVIGMDCDFKIIDENMIPFVVEKDNSPLWSIGEDLITTFSKEKKMYLWYMEDCSVEEIPTLKVTPIHAQWITPSMAIVFKVESNQDWEIV